MTRLAALVLVFALPAVGCGAEPETSVLLSLDYDDALGLDTAEISLGGITKSVPIEHRLLLLVSVPDSGPGITGSVISELAVWGRSGGRRLAYDASLISWDEGRTSPASLTLAACAPGCQDGMLVTCEAPPIACPLGCLGEGDGEGLGTARCNSIMPSNGVDASAADPVQGTITIQDETTFDVDTGAISGGLTQAPGTRDGRDGGIGYLQLPPVSQAGRSMGVFVFHNLTVRAFTQLHFVGTRAVVLLVGGVAKIDGDFDLAGGRGTTDTPGPGGGRGGTASLLASGCGAGQPGGSSTGLNSGGAGGSGGSLGGAGGAAGTVPGGATRVACLAAGLEPLRGGSGGGAGSLAVEQPPAVTGGGGGGALQISALGSLEITGSINASGAGGDGGNSFVSRFVGAGGGGGSGGAILLEAPAVILGRLGMLAANGGGGGGGATANLPGTAGADGGDSTFAPRGGSGGSAVCDGGNGGYLGNAGVPGKGGTGVDNGGGGGGGVGAIVIRAGKATLDGRSSPPAVQLGARPRPAR